MSVFGVEMNMSLVTNVIVIAVLAALGIVDIRRRSVGVVWLVVIMAASCVYRCVNLQTDVYCAVTGLVLLAGLAAYCRLTGSIGAADVVVMAFLGVMKGTVFAVASSMLAMAAASSVMIIYRLIKRVSGKSTVPFIPFLGAGVLGVMLCA